VLAFCQLARGAYTWLAPGTARAGRLAACTLPRGWPPPPAWPGEPIGSLPKSADAQIDNTWRLGTWLGGQEVPIYLEQPAASFYGTLGAKPIQIQNWTCECGHDWTEAGDA